MLNIIKNSSYISFIRDKDHREPFTLRDEGHWGPLTLRDKGHWAYNFI